MRGGQKPGNGHISEKKDEAQWIGWIGNAKWGAKISSQRLQQPEGGENKGGTRNKKEKRKSLPPRTTMGKAP